MMQGDGSGSSMRRQNSGRKLCFCRLDAEIRQAWTDKNPGRRFYGCPCYKEKNGCKYFKWFDIEDGTEWQKMALIEARDEIREQSRVIKQLNETIAELAKNLERIQQEEEIDDGIHFRQPWTFGVEDEVRHLKMEVTDMAEEIAKLKRLITSTSRP
ncbi:hypothetical protein Rs2_21367 [Raphanus sativus]|nr:hypothetical protein Rs2_21367 [Raphanus sativus]